MSNSTHLVIGQRYWLDNVRDVSGIYIGFDGHSYNFNSVDTNTCYLPNNDGSVSFSNPVNFYPVIDADLKQELITRLYNLKNTIDIIRGNTNGECPNGVSVAAWRALELYINDADKTLKKLIP